MGQAEVKPAKTKTSVTHLLNVACGNSLAEGGMCLGWDECGIESGRGSRKILLIGGGSPCVAII